MEQTYKLGQNLFSFSTMDNRAVLRRVLDTPQGRAALGVGGATASSFLAGLTQRAIDNLVNNARAAGGQLFENISEAVGSYVRGDSVSGGSSSSNNAIQDNEISSTRGEAPQKRPRIEEPAEAPSEAVDARMASMQGRQVAGGGAANQDSGDSYVARPLSINRQKLSLKYNKRFYFRLSTFLPRLYDEGSPNSYYLFDPTYAFDFSSLVWYVNQTEMDELFGLMSFSQVKCNNYSAQIKLVGQQSLFVTNVESQIPANPNMPTLIEVGSNLEASIPVALAEVDISSGNGPRLTNKFMVPSFGSEAPGQEGPGQSITLPANMVERLYDITAAFPTLKGANAINWRYPQFNRFMNVYDGAKSYGTLVDCYEEPKECYMSVERSVSNDNNALRNVDIPTANHTQYYLGGTQTLTPLSNVLDNNTQIYNTPSGYRKSYRTTFEDLYRDGMSFRSFLRFWTLGPTSNAKFLTSQTYEVPTRNGKQRNFLLCYQLWIFF